MGLIPAVPFFERTCRDHWQVGADTCPASVMRSVSHGVTPIDAFFSNTLHQAWNAKSCACLANASTSVKDAFQPTSCGVTGSPTRDLASAMSTTPLKKSSPGKFGFVEESFVHFHAFGTSLITG